jgi:hypothetical protein
MDNAFGLHILKVIFNKMERGTVCNIPSIPLLILLSKMNNSSINTLAYCLILLFIILYMYMNRDFCPRHHVQTAVIFTLIPVKWMLTSVLPRAGLVKIFLRTRAQIVYNFRRNSFACPSTKVGSWILA